MMQKNSVFTPKKAKKEVIVAEIVSTTITDLVAGMGFEPHDLRVMSPTSYQAALPRDIMSAAKEVISHSHNPPGYRCAPPQAHSRLSRLVDSARHTPCFVRFHFVKTILNRFYSFTQRATKLLYPAIFKCDLSSNAYVVPVTGLEPVRYFRITGF